MTAPTIKPFLGAVVLALSLAVLAAPQAHAETVTRADDRNDAPSSIDIRKTTYSHAQRRVGVVARISDLGQRGTAALSISKFTIFEAGYVLRIKKRPGAEPAVRLYYFNHFELEPRECSAVRGKWGDDKVRLQVARHCLDGHIRKRLFVQFGIQRGHDTDQARPVKRIKRS